MRTSLFQHAVLFGFLAVCAASLAAAQTDSPPTAAATNTQLTLDAKNSSITYMLVHKMHKVAGTSHGVEGRARIAENGQAQVAVRARVDTFDSGNSNRDEHMKETVEAAKYPFVELKAVGDASKPGQLPATVNRTFKVELTFHAVRKNFEVPVKLTYDPSGHIRAEGDLTISLDGFQIERPSLMFIKVDDAVRIHASLAFQP